ncbi:MAG: type II toxin-antitoxin system Phd/YefM family antitoxin [Gammaproteobacteria bacterium]
MHASIVDLRYKMKDVIRALDRNEPVTILYHGKVKGTIQPASSAQQARPATSAEQHPFFGMTADAEPSVEAVMEELRGPRHRDL